MYLLGMRRIHKFWIHLEPDPLDQIPLKNFQMVIEIINKEKNQNENN